MSGTANSAEIVLPWSLYNFSLAAPDTSGEMQILLHDDPYLDAQSKWHPTAGLSAQIISTVENSIDGSGSWLGLHLFRGTTFIVGGWIRGKKAK